MFHNIPKPILNRMRELEDQDSLDREDGTPHLQRLRQIPPVTGKFLALLCASAPQGGVLEVGTSGGYSSLWLSLACQARGDHLLTTFEIMEKKVARANETFEVAQVSDQIQLIHGDAREVIAGYREVAFCFLDAEKGVYMDIYEKVVPNLVPGGILAADNVVSHAEALSDFVAQAEDDARVDALVVPIGKGILICRKQ
jgi:predicted O-methyltransferase YrrM